MENLVKTTEKNEVEEEFSLKKLFVPLTTLKAIHWIIFIGLIVYANMLLNPAVWDDNTYILGNSSIKVISFQSFFGDNIFNNSGQYRPLTVSYYSFLYTIFGNNLFFYHVIQLSFHITNATLLFILLKKFFGNKLAFFLSLIFLIHPIQIESVSYVSATDSTLFFLLGLISLLMVVYRKISYKNIFIQTFLLLSSVLVKETGALFIPLIPLYKYLINKKNILIDFIGALIIALIYFCLRYGIGNIADVDRPLIPIDRLNFAERMLSVPQVIFYYLKTFFYPVTLGINQQWVVTSATLLNFYLPLFLDALFFSLLFFFGYRIYRNNKKAITVYVFFSVWFLLGLAIHSQSIPLDATVADRWAYFGIAGLLGILGVIIQEFLVFKIKFNYKLLTIAAFIVILLLTVRTLIRNADWQNPVYLWKQAITIDDNYLSENELSLALINEGKLTEALLPAKKSVALFPNDLSYYNLGYIYDTLGQISLAKQAYLSGYHAKNYIPWSHKHYLALYTRIARIMVYYDDQKQTEKFIKTALNDYPDSPQLWNLLSINEYKLHNHSAALDAARQATILDPNNYFLLNVYQSLIYNQPLNIRYK